MSESKEDVEQQQQQQATDVSTPTKRTPKRKADELFKKESEELLKTLGVSLDMEDGRRRTRSSARGATPTTTPATPPSKRARGATTPKQAEESKSPNASTTTPKKRGVQGERKRLLVLMDPALPKEYTDNVSTAENDEMDATDSTATVAEDDDGGKAPEATESKGAEEKEENVKENDLKEDEEAEKEVLSDKKGEEKDTDDVTDSVTKPAENAVAKDEEPVKEPVSDSVPAKVEVQPATTDNAPNTECLEEKKTEEEAMEVDVDQGKKDEVQTNEKKSDDTKKEEVVVVDDTKKKVTVEAVCESNGSNTNITPKKPSEPEVVKPDVVEKICLENDKQPATATTPIKTDSTVVEAATPSVDEETKVDENNSTAQVDKDTALVNNVTDAKDVEKVVTPIEVEAKIVTSEGTATTIEPSPTPE